VPTHFGTGQGAVLVADGAYHGFVLLQAFGQVFRGVAQYLGALFERGAGLLHHVLEDRVGGQGEQFFMEVDIGVHAGFGIADIQRFAHVHQGQAQLADFLAADRLGHQADDERFEGVAQLQDVLEAGIGHGVARLRLADAGFQHDHAFARHGAHQAEGLQHDYRFAQARAADT